MTSVVQRRSLVDSLIAQVLNSAREHGVSVHIDFPADDDDGNIYVKFGDYVYCLCATEHGVGCHKSFKGQPFKRCYLKTLLNDAPSDVAEARRAVAA